MELASEVAQWIGDLLLDGRTADMVFIVEGERLPAHRAILSTSCEYFRALLYGSMKESFQPEVILEDVPLRGFKLVLSYIYTGQPKVGEVDEHTLVEVLFIAHMYGITKLESFLSDYIKKNLSLRNVCTIYNKAHCLKLENLGEACFNFMIQEPDVILRTEAFCDLSEAALCHVLSLDAFNASEIEIFKAVLRWRTKRPSERSLGDVLKQIRLPLIDTEDLLTTVQDSGLISLELLMDAIKTRVFHAADRNFRGSLKKDVNLATSRCGALRAKPARCRCEDVVETMPLFTSELSFDATAGFLLALREPFFINHIRFKICNRCSYYIEVSYDRINWARVIDYSKYSCDSFQDLYFERRVVRYIRIIGALSNKRNYPIRITKLGVDHTTKPFKLIHGFYAPEENVSSSAKGAIIFSGPNNPGALINHENTEYKEDSKWTSHVIGDEGILIKLPHPYTVDSMRMLLRSDGSRAYMYYVETSLNYKTWTRVTDRATDFCRSWQHMTFTARPVLYIKIVGTASKVEKIFSCSRFECPAPPRDPN